MNIFDQPLQSGDDVFAVRQRSRSIAGAVGFDQADQVRLATALSELGRDVVAVAPGGHVSFSVDDDGCGIVITVAGLTAHTALGSPGLAAARRLMRDLDVVATSPSPGVDVVMTRPLPLPLSRARMEQVRREIATIVVLSPLEELRTQNAELVTTLEQLQLRQTQLELLNHELEETNRGVMAMYSQLSEELESTNRGVVALYAELDDKSRQLQASDEAKSRFLTSVSHELRSPVASVLGLSNLLLDAEPPLAGEQSRQVELIARNAAEQLQLVNELLDLAKAESGRLDPRVERVAVAPIVAEVAESVRALAQPGVEVVADAPSEPLEVDIDASLLRQIVRNLVTNALAFTSSGSVRVTTMREGDDVVIAVVDTGVGIPEEHLEHIFEEFFQVRGPLQVGRKGTGLGLPFARTVAEALGGSLTVTSEVGRGSTFRLRFPVASDSFAAPPEPAKEADHRPDPAMRVLVVDDDPGFRRIVVQMLTPFVAAVFEADDGAPALDLLARQPVDAVLLDLVMPNVGGAEVIRRMAEQPELRSVPVVIVTSMDVAWDRSAGGGASGYLPKHDLTVDLLLRTLRDVAGVR